MTFAPPPGRTPRGLLIDYGGVLTTSVFESFHAFERREGLEPSAVVRRLRDPRGRDLLAGLETGTAPDARFEAGLAALLGVSGENLIVRLLGSTEIEESMIRAVRTAHEGGVRTALVSNSWGPRGYPPDLLGELFDAVVLSGEVALRKPDPKIYLLAAGRLGLDPRECVFVDDLPGNLEPAARLGMATVHHTDPARTAAELGRLFGLELPDFDPDPDPGADPGAGPDPAQAR